MAKILAVGIATLDIVNIVADFPSENEEVRALSQQKSRGGNATNTLTVLSQLGHQCTWSGVLVYEADSQFIKDELREFNIDYSLCRQLTAGKIPTSYITLNQQTGSRTIVHHRDCPEFSFADFKAIDLNQFDWVHFEGRHIDDTLQMLQYLKQQQPDLLCSVEIEKPRENIECLFPLADYLFFSQYYAESKGHSCAVDLLNSLPENSIASCAWGEQGAWAIQQQKIFHSPAYPPSQLIDTLGAGDTFNAVMIDHLIQQYTLQEALKSACQLAGKKCGQQGLKDLIL